jgi:hypothetical protein
MWCRLTKTLFAVALLAGPSFAARAQNNDIPCDAFQKNDDGTWSAMRSVQILGTGQRLTIRDGSVLRPGSDIRGLDLATELDRKCPATPEPVEPAPSAQPGQPVQPGRPGQPVQSARTQPYIALGTYADLYGNIDPQRLTCGQLADASPQEAELLLAWYSGWFNGAAKKRAMNLAQVGSAVHSAIDYCKGNRDKKLNLVMELMLK